MSARDYFAVVGRRRRRSSVISVFRHRDGPVKKIKFSPFFKNKQSFQNSRFLGKMSARDYFAVVGRRRRPSSVISLFRHRDGPVKKSNFRRFSKTSNISKFKIVMQNECTRFFDVVGRGRRWSSGISLFRQRDGPVKKIKFSQFFKNKQSFQNPRFLGKMSARDYFAVVGRRRRQSSVISLFRHRDGPVKKIKFSPFFKNKQYFQNSRLLCKMSARDYFDVVGRRRRRSSVISLFPHRDGTSEKNQIFAVFQKQAIFPKFKIFRQNECTRLFRRRRSSPSSLVRHFPLSSQGRTSEKNQIFDVFQKQAIFPNSRLLCKVSARDFFDVVGRGRRRSSVISLFRQRYGPVKKNQIFTVFQKQPIFPKFKIFRQNECTRFFSASWVVAVVARPSFPSFVTGTDL